METGKRVGVQVWVHALWQGNEESKVMRERLHQTAVWNAEDTVFLVIGWWAVGKPVPVFLAPKRPILSFHV